MEETVQGHNGVMNEPRLHAFATFSSMRSRSSRRRASMETRSRSSRRRITPCSTNATCAGRRRGGAFHA